MNRLNTGSPVLKRWSEWSCKFMLLCSNEWNTPWNLSWQDDIGWNWFVEADVSVHDYFSGILSLHRCTDWLWMWSEMIKKHVSLQLSLSDYWSETRLKIIVSLYLLDVFTIKKMCIILTKTTQSMSSILWLPTPTFEPISSGVQEVIYNKYLGLFHRR